MKIFLSWSGKRSKAVGELLDEWLQCVLQAVKPWMSSKDIDRGALWFSEINDQLKDIGVGIICVTSTNLNKPWILFEAGALAKGLSSSRVCTFLIDLNPADISDPLAQFNHTLPNKDGLYSLVRTLNRSLGEKGLGEKLLNNVFETYWPQFEKSFYQVIEDTKDDEVEVKREDTDILSELLYATRKMDKRLRAIETNTDINSRIDNTRKMLNNSRFKDKILNESMKKEIDSTVDDQYYPLTSISNEDIRLEFEEYQNKKALIDELTAKFKSK